MGFSFSTLIMAGSMGVIVYTIYRVFNLIASEQKKDIPRPAFLKAIWVSMGFAIGMALLALFIEYTRFNMGNKSTSLADEIIKISEQNYFSIDKNGNPVEIKLDTVVLSKAYSNSHFKDTHLKLSQNNTSKYPVIKKGLKDMVLGYIDDSDIKSIIENSKPKDKYVTIKPNELWSLGWINTPSNAAEIIDYKTEKDKKLAADYLVKYLKKDGNKNETQTENAIKLLTQPSLMNILKKDQYEILINALKSGIRETPWDKYELAQVHISRSGQTWNESNSASDVKTSKDYLADYKDFYETHEWIRNVEKYPIATEWYNKLNDEELSKN